ncbi:hypothetical protein ACFFLM_12425 [Deinococcus oregonensis]|uniref:Uncharacterized protein n=1 Tax=Deinococcus oregonensis TaxID=1805970 RepID=A0ABV6AZ33_9DEIO
MNGQDRSFDRVQASLAEFQVRDVTEAQAHTLAELFAGGSAETR